MDRPDGLPYYVNDLRITADVFLNWIESWSERSAMGYRVFRRPVYFGQNI